MCQGFWHATLNIGETLAVGSWPDGLHIHKERGALINEVQIASKKKVSTKEAKKLVSKVDKMLKKYGANSHLIDAKVCLRSAAFPLSHLNAAGNDENAGILQAALLAAQGPARRLPNRRGVPRCHCWCAL